MHFTPGERTVLTQIRVLYYASGRDQHVRALSGLWLPAHYDTYRNAYAGLVAKQLIQDVSAQMFKITDLGLKAMGIKSAAPRAEPSSTDVPPVRGNEIHLPATQATTQKKRQKSLFSQLTDRFRGG